MPSDIVNCDTGTCRLDAIVWLHHSALVLSPLPLHLTGVLNVTTSTSGKFNTSLDLSTVDPAPLPGSVISFSAEWIGPTRERITASASTAVRYSEYELVIGTSIQDPLPGRSLAVTAEVTGPSLDRISVEVRVTVLYKRFLRLRVI